MTKATFGIDAYAATLFTFGADYAYRQMAIDFALNYKGLAVQGRDKALANLVGFASVGNSI